MLGNVQGVKETAMNDALIQLMDVDIIVASRIRL